MQLDSGSDISIINTQTWKNIGKPTLFKSNKIARAVSGRKINFVGEGWLHIHFNNKKMRIFVMLTTYLEQMLSRNLTYGIYPYRLSVTK